MFTACVSRPDMHAVAIVSWYLANPGREHWLAVKRILRYIKGAINFGILFDGLMNNDQLTGC